MGLQARSQWPKLTSSTTLAFPLRTSAMPWTAPWQGRRGAASARGCRSARRLGLRGRSSRRLTTGLRRRDRVRVPVLWPLLLRLPAMRAVLALVLVRCDHCSRLLGGPKKAAGPARALRVQQEAASLRPLAAQQLQPWDCPLALALVSQLLEARTPCRMLLHTLIRQRVRAPPGLCWPCADAHPAPGQSVVGGRLALGVAPAFLRQGRVTRTAGGQVSQESLRLCWTRVGRMERGMLLPPRRRPRFWRTCSCTAACTSPRGSWSETPPRPLSPTLPPPRSRLRASQAVQRPIPTPGAWHQWRPSPAPRPQHSLRLSLQRCWQHSQRLHTTRTCPWCVVPDTVAALSCRLRWPPCLDCSHASLRWQLGQHRCLSMPPGLWTHPWRALWQHRR